jgi:hypothetical protein
MSIHQDLVENNDLFREFDKLAGYEHVSPAEISVLMAMVLEVAARIGPHLDRIQNTFQQYTSHDIQHLLNVASHIHSFLPKVAARGQVVGLNAVELAYLWLAILLHDVGMFVEQAEEKQAILDSAEYQDFLRHQQDRMAARQSAAAAGRTVTAQVIDDALFAEFIRRQHASRVHKYISKHLADRLQFREIDFSTEVGNLCESHNWGVREARESGQPSVDQLETRDFVGKTRVNLRYLACCLRLGDIFDFDRTRTPLSAFQQMHFTDSLSLQEWNKHLSIKGISISEHRVSYDAKCGTPEDYVAVQHFLDWVDRELQQCLDLIDEFPQGDADRYFLSLSPVVDRHRIRMADPRVVAGAFRFHLEYDRILQLLMDKSLYPDETLFLRELLQNSLDACRYQRALALDKGMGDKYTPRIQVWDHSDATPDEGGPRIIFRDNGVGMSLHQVENYFMRVGKSFYTSPDFRAERQRLAEKGIHLEACSQFGIGFLSCFLGGDRIEVDTYRHGSEPLKISINGPSKFFVIKRLMVPADVEIPFNSPADPTRDLPPRCAGTDVTVFLRDGWHANPGPVPEGLVYETLNAVAVNQDVPITIFGRTRPAPDVVPARRWDEELPLAPRWRGLNHDGSHLVPSMFSLESCGESMRGMGAIWFLSDSGEPTVRKGDLCVRGGEIRLDGIVASVLALVQVGVGESVCEELANELDEFQENPGGCVRTWNRLQRYLADRQPFSRVEDVGALSREDLEWAIRTLRGGGSRARRDWEHDREDAEALLARDRERLAQQWAKRGVPSGPSCPIWRHYQLALFGIACPGGFQTWEPAKGSAARRECTPYGMAVNADLYGGLAPRPAASRLYVPDERSQAVRGAITRAFLLHARQLWISHRDSDEWVSWYESFLTQPDMIDSPPLLEDPDIRRLVTEFRDARPKKPNIRFYELLGQLHSPFGAWVLFGQWVLEGGGLDILRPLPIERFEVAADQVGLDRDKIPKMVDSLSEFIGWDVTKGHPAYPNDP